MRGQKPEITFQTATKQDEEYFHLSPLFFASDGRQTHVVEALPMDEIPFIVTGGKDAASPGRRRGERKGKRGGRHLRNKAMDAGVPRSRMETSFCSVCQAKNQGLVAMCLRCGHGGHLKHIREWFSDDVNNRRRKCAIVTCQCHCVFVEENGNSVQWRVCFRRALSLFRYAEAKGAFFVWIFLVHTGSLHDLLAVFQYPTSCLVL